MVKRLAAKAAFPRSGHNHDQCVTTALSAADAVCARAGQRLTTLRRRVLELVWASHRPVGAYALLDELKKDGRGAAPPTVYRALEFLLECGLIHRIESLNAYVGCSHPGEAHLTQFLICKSCGTAAELDDKRLGEVIGRSAAEHGFTIANRIVELSGTCSACRSGRARSEAALDVH